MPPKKSGGWGRGRGSNNTSIGITQQGGFGTLLPTPMGGFVNPAMGQVPLLGQPQMLPNGLMGAATPHPLFSTMLGAPAGNVDVTMTAAQMQQFQAQIQLGMQAQMAEAAKQKEAADSVCKCWPGHADRRSGLRTPPGLRHAHTRSIQTSGSAGTP